MGGVAIYNTYQTTLFHKETISGNILLFIAEHIKNLYNQINYEIRKTLIVDYRYYYDKYITHWRTKYIDQGTLQQTISSLISNWTSYQKVICRYRNTNIHEQIPNVPGFKNNLSDVEIIIIRNAIHFINDSIIIQLTSAVKERFEIDSIAIPFVEIWGFNYQSKREQINAICNGIRQIRLLWSKHTSQWLIRIIYNRVPNLLPCSYKNVMAIDVGLNNLCALTFRYGTNSYLICGRPLKSYNRFSNYNIDRIQGRIMKQLGSSLKYSEPQNIKILRNKRDNFIQNYFHQASKRCIDIALLEKCKVIVLGDLKGIKKGSKNRSFVQIPLVRFVEMIKYKAEIAGIRVIVINEAYTSISSAIDLEEINYEAGRAARRIYRGAFISNGKIFVNSDINGSLNILRKFLNLAYSKRISDHNRRIDVNLEGSIPELISVIRDKGYVVNPRTIQILNNKI